MLKHFANSSHKQRCFHTHSFLYQRHKQQHYDILQVHRHSDKKAIKTQYYRLSKRFHPDLNPSDKEAHAKFLQVNDAYAVLGNEASRRQYDAELDRLSPSATTTGHHNSSYAHNVRQASSAYYAANRPGYTGPSVAWRAKAKRARNTGSASARAQADEEAQQQHGNFNHQEHFAKHYQAEELRRRERVMNAAKRRKAAGDEDDEGDGTGKTKLNVWSRLWRLGVLLVGISYVTRTILDYQDDDQKRKRKEQNGFLIE